MNLQSHAEKYLLHRTDKTAKRLLFALINNNSNVSKRNYLKKIKSQFSAKQQKKDTEGQRNNDFKK